MDYKPYSPEWHRKRYLKEALDNYFNEYVDVEIIYNDIMDVLNERSEQAYFDFQRTVELESMIHNSSKSE